MEARLYLGFQLIINWNRGGVGPATLDASGPPITELLAPPPEPLVFGDSGIALPESVAGGAAREAIFDGVCEIPENGAGKWLSPITTLLLPIVTPPQETALPVTAAGMPFQYRCGTRGNSTRMRRVLWFGVWRERVANAGDGFAINQHIG